MSSGKGGAFASAGDVGEGGVVCGFFSAEEGAPVPRAQQNVCRSFLFFLVSFNSPFINS